MLSRCFLDFSVGVGAIVIGLSQISSFSLINGICTFHGNGMDPTKLLVTKHSIWKEKRNYNFFRKLSVKVFISLSRHYKIVTIIFLAYNEQQYRRVYIGCIIPVDMLRRLNIN